MYCYERSAILLASAHAGGSTSIPSSKKQSPRIVERKGFHFYFVFPFYLSPCGEALRLLDLFTSSLLLLPVELLSFVNICLFSFNVLLLRSCSHVFAMGVEYKRPLCIHDIPCAVLPCASVPPPLHPAPPLCVIISEDQRVRLLLTRTTRLSRGLAVLTHNLCPRVNLGRSPP